MIKDKLVKNTIYISLFVQFLTTILSYDGLSYKLKDKDKVLSDVLRLELIVQIIEFCFYIWVIFALKNLKIMTPRRYIDWAITTPTMLISSIIYMKYKEYQEKNDPRILTFKGFIQDNKQIIKKIVILNGLMLLFGYLGETNRLDKNKSILIGFFFFFWYFKIIYDNYAKHSKAGKKLFYFLIIIWGFYGVASILGDINKNASYNILDIIAKNFYGLFIYYVIKKISIKESQKIEDINGLEGSIKVIPSSVDFT